MPRGRVLVAVAVLAVAVVGVVAFVALPRGTTEVSDREAIEDFRAGSPDEEPRSTGPSAGGPELPRAGVYTYSTTGEEVVKLGPLPAETRELPPSVTAVARDVGDGCFEWTLNLFVEHTETTRYCVDADGVSIASHTKRQQIGALSPTADMTCDPDLLATADEPRRELRCELTLDGGPASIVAELAGPVTAGPSEDVAIGDGAVSVVPVRVEMDLSGDLSGSWVETTWWSDDHVPVRIERSLDFEGLASFTERSELELVGLDPAT